VNGGDEAVNSTASGTRKYLKLDDDVEHHWRLLLSLLEEVEIALLSKVFTFYGIPTE